MVNGCKKTGEVCITSDGNVTKDFNDAHDEKVVMDDYSNWIKILSDDAHSRGKDFLFDIYKTDPSLIINDYEFEGITLKNRKVDYVYVLTPLDKNDG